MRVMEIRNDLKRIALRDIPTRHLTRKYNNSKKNR
jgi:hypothetical protein